MSYNEDVYGNSENSSKNLAKRAIEYNNELMMSKHSSYCNAIAWLNAA